jgi:hypothetical protein
MRLGQGTPVGPASCFPMRSPFLLHARPILPPHALRNWPVDLTRQQHWYRTSSEPFFHYRAGSALPVVPPSATDCWTWAASCFSSEDLARTRTPLWPRTSMAVPGTPRRGGYNGSAERPTSAHLFPSWANSNLQQVRRRVRRRARGRRCRTRKPRALGYLWGTLELRRDSLTPWRSLISPLGSLRTRNSSSEVLAPPRNPSRRSPPASPRDCR